MDDDLLDDIPISEDDVVINIRFAIIFTADENKLNFENEWINKPINNAFRNYTFHNAVRVNKIMYEENRMTIVVKLLDPEVSFEAISGDAENKLYGVLESLGIQKEAITDIGMETIGGEQDAMEQADNYVKQIRKNDKGKSPPPKRRGKSKPKQKRKGSISLPKGRRK